MDEGRKRGADEVGDAPAWVQHFLCGLIVTGSLRQALDEAGIDFDTAWALRERAREFAMFWDRALRVHRRIMAGEHFLDAFANEEATVN